MRYLALTLILLLTVAPGAAEARMYQWVNPGTNSVQLSGKAPPWYRSPQGGPRVLVYENGTLVDDTAVLLPEDQSQQLRQAAFGLPEAAADDEPAEDSAAAADDEGPLLAPPPAVAGGGPPGPTPKPRRAPQQEQEPLESSIEGLKSIIRAWDRRNSELDRLIQQAANPNQR